MSARVVVLLLALACASLARADEPDLQTSPPISAPALSAAVIELASRGNELEPAALERLLRLPGLAGGLEILQAPERDATRNRSTIFRPRMAELDISLVDLEWRSSMGSGKTAWRSYLRLVVQREACPTAAILSQALGKPVTKTETMTMLDDHWSPMTFIAFDMPTPGMHPAAVAVYFHDGCEIMISRDRD